MANTIEIVIKQSGQGNAISATVKELGGLDKAASSSIGALGRFGSALGGMATIAGGIVVANVFGKIAEGIGSMVSTGLDAVGSNQQLETSLKSLLTANNMYAESTETLQVAVGNLAEMQAEAADKSDDLSFKQKKLTASINEQNASIQEQRQRIIQMADGLDKTQQIARLGEMEVALEGMQRELADTVTEQGKLNNITQEYETVTRTSIKTVMSQADAFKLAGQQTEDLLDFVARLAVVSPFETKTVEDVTKYAIAAGMGVDATKEFIPAFLDLAASVGITSESLGFAADQLFQVKKVGKLTEIDLRQLRRIGIDLSKVIGVEMGMSVEEFNAQAAKSPEIFDELFAAVARFSQNTFAGTSKEMATSVKGLQSTISDIFVIGSRTFMRPLVDAVTPAISEIIGKISDMVLGGDLETLGQQFADTIMGGISTASSIFNIAKVLGIEAALATVAQMVENAWPGIAEKLTGWGLQFWGFIDTTVIPLAEQAFTQLANYIGSLIASYWPVIETQLFTWRDQFFSWVTTLYPQIPNLLTNLVNQIATAVRDNWPAIQIALSEWAAKFWEWTNTAVAGAGVALAAILGAVTAWATSSEAQASLNTMGQELGKAIYQGIAFLMENHQEAAEVLLKLVAGLAAAVAIIAGDLIMIGGQIVAGILSGILESMGVDLEPALISELQGILQGLAENSMTIIREVAKKIVKGLNDGMVATLKSGMSFGEEAKKWIGEIGGSIRDALTELTEDVFPLFTKGIDSVIESIKNFVSSMKEAISTVADFVVPDILMPGSPPPLATSFMDIATGADTAANAVKGFMANLAAGGGLKGGSIKNTIRDQLEFSARMFMKKGSLEEDERNQAKKALFNAFEQTYSGIVAGTKGKADFLNVFKQGLKDFDLKEFNEAVGLVATKVEGFIATIRSQFGPLTMEMKAQAVSMAQSFSSLAAGFAGMVQDQIQGAAKAKEEAGKLGEANVRLTETLGDQQEKMNQLQADLLELTGATELDTEAIKRKQAAITDLSEAMTKNQATIAENEEALKKHRQELEQKSFARFNTAQGSLEGDLATIELLQDFLKGDASEFIIPSDAVSQAAGITGIIYDRVFAQAELNRLLAEQAERERQIAEQQKAQQQLSFLQQQVELLKQGQALGINVFEGMTFGLNASAADLLAATNALVNAMVAEIDSSLQIHSPSKLIFDKFKNQVGGAAVRGLMAVKPLLTGIVEPMLSPLTGDYSRTTNNNFSMTVNTRAESSSVIGDFRTMQLLAG